MSRFDEVFGWRDNWTFHPHRRIVKSHSESEPTNESDCGNSEPNKREASSRKIEQVRKKLTDSETSSAPVKLLQAFTEKANKPFRCVTEPFKKTLELLEDWEWDT